MPTPFQHLDATQPTRPDDPMRDADERRAFAAETDDDEPRTLAELTAEYQIWTAANGYPEAGSADELLMDVAIAAQNYRAAAANKQRHVDWLADFITRWNAAQDTADTSDQKRREWTAARVWCADLDTAGLPHALDGDDTRSGYAYPMGCYIKDTGNGTYWTVADRGDVTGTLDHCERFLWEHHARHETAT